MLRIFKSFLNDESGATAIEYGLIAALISVAVLTVLGTVGDNLESTFDNVGKELAKGAGG